MENKVSTALRFDSALVAQTSRSWGGWYGSLDLNPVLDRLGAFEGRIAELVEGMRISQKEVTQHQLAIDSLNASLVDLERDGRRSEIELPYVDSLKDSKLIKISDGKMLIFGESQEELVHAINALKSELRQNMDMRVVVSQDEIARMQIAMSGMERANDMLATFIKKMREMYDAVARS